MSEQPVIHVCGSMIDGRWYVSGGMGTRIMVAGPTLTEAVAALVVAMAHGGKVDPREFKLSPVYLERADDDDFDPAELSVSEWERLIREGLIICDEPGQK